MKKKKMKICMRVFIFFLNETFILLTCININEYFEIILEKRI
jgi:hypothetical protein